MDGRITRRMSSICVIFMYFLCRDELIIADSKRFVLQQWLGSEVEAGLMMQRGDCVGDEKMIRERENEAGMGKYFVDNFSLWSSLPLPP